jgi:GAF domain-containing protein
MAATQQAYETDVSPRDGTRQLAVLNRIARIATADIELRPMLQRIVDALHQAYGWEFVACASVDRAQHRFVCEALHSDLPSEIAVGYTRALGTGVVGEVALTGHAIDLDDVGGHENFLDTLHGTRSELCVPVLHQGEVLAVLNVESQRGSAFRGQRVLLETVAEQIAGVIAIARLHAELRRRAELFQTASELSRAALEAASFELALDRIAEFIRDRFELELTGIFVANHAGQLVLRARAGASCLSEPLGQAWTLDRGIVPRAFRTGETQYVPDVALDPDYVTGNANVRCELAIPIRLQGRLLGVINLESARPDSFGGDNRPMLEALAAQVAGAIHLAELAQRQVETNRLLEQRTAELQSANAQLRHANLALEQL